jgi:glutathione synthase/RimK-type ligase-like ATP-grasp enzyme
MRTANQAEGDGMRDRIRRAVLTRLVGLDVEDYAAFGFRRRPLREAGGYVGWPVVKSWLPVLDPPEARGVLDDKEEFARVLAAAGLGVPETITVHDPEADDPMAVRTAVAPFRDGVVLKPARGGRGRGVVIFTSLDAEGRTGTTVRGKRVRLHKALARSVAVGEGPVIVQRRLRQHRALDPFSPQGHSTVRVYTLLRGDGTVRFLGAHLRLGREGSMTDHVWGGSVGAHVDLDTGTIGRGVQVGQGRAEPTDRHPDTGVTFRGEVVPCWDDVRELCRTAAQLFPRTRLVGWDVMVTDEGPRMLEGNWNIRLRTMQVLHGGLLDDSLRADLEELGIVFPDGPLHRLLLRRPDPTDPRWRHP